jgi:nickel transport protein
MDRRLLPLALLAVLLTTPAWAHKVIASTYVLGGAVEGEIGFSNGDMAADALVTVTTPDGRPLGEARTDAEGFFTFTPTEAVDHVFRADLGAGHVAEVTVQAAELSQGGGGTTTTTTVAARAAARAEAADLPPGVREMIAETVRDEVRPLRRELVAYREKTDLQGILGGIGYIVGLFGVGFYVVGRQRLKTA